jgi:hypothetical protein
MRHLNSGEMKLFNVAEDYREECDLAAEMPEKVAEMNRIRQKYIDEVDGGEVEEVYAAYTEWLEDGLREKESKFQMMMQTLDETKPADIDVQKAKLQDELEKTKREFRAKRGINKAMMSNRSWRDGAKLEAMERMGTDKKGNALRPK